MRVVVPTSSGRDARGPALSLIYSSGGGGSELGVGWSLAGIPAIGIDTREHAPRWDGGDGYSSRAASWCRGSSKRALDGGRAPAPPGRRRSSTIAAGSEEPRFASRSGSRPRPAGSTFARATRATSSRSTARARSGGRIADPGRRDTNVHVATGDPDRSERLGDVARVRRGDSRWRRSRGTGRAAPADSCEALPQAHPLQQRGAVRDRRRGDRGTAAGELRWCFETVFDYGDHSSEVPGIAPDRAWPARLDPTTNTRCGFPVRTYRLCRRILTFHAFDELGATPALVGVLGLQHDEAIAGSTLRQIDYTGYRRDGAALTSVAVPPLVMSYAPAAIEPGFHDVPIATAENIPAGLASRADQLCRSVRRGTAGDSDRDRARVALQAEPRRGPVRRRDRRVRASGGSRRRRLAGRSRCRR